MTPGRGPGGDIQARNPRSPLLGALGARYGHRCGSQLGAAAEAECLPARTGSRAGEDGSGGSRLEHVEAPGMTDGHGGNAHIQPAPVRVLWSVSALRPEHRALL